MSDEQISFLEGIEISNSGREEAFMSDTDSILNKYFMTGEVREIVNHAKCGKAPGLDGLLNECVKNDASINMLTILFHKCLSTGLIPTYWV